jgi:hypothetical protein
MKHETRIDHGRTVTSPALERDLVQECRVVAKAMNVMLCEVGQYQARKSGTTVGFPDLVAIVAGKVVLIETKRAKGGVLSIGQEAFIERAAEQGVHVFVVDRIDDFVAIVNSCRRAKGVARTVLGY